jgi:hypothetical protein
VLPSPCSVPSTNSPEWLGSTYLLESKLFWLVLYFSFNLSLTLHNKVVLMRFPFPYTLTALHALCGSVGGHILLETGAFHSAKLLPGDTAALAAFSILYAVNVVVSNISLQLVTIPVRLLQLQRRRLRDFGFSFIKSSGP